MGQSVLDLVGLGFDEGDVVLVLLGPGLHDALDLAVGDRGKRHDYETSIILMIRPTNRSIINKSPALALPRPQKVAVHYQLQSRWECDICTNKNLNQ